MNKKTLIIISIVAALIIIIVAIMFYRAKQKSKKEIENLSEEKPDIVPAAKPVISQNYKDVYANLPNGGIPIAIGQRSKLSYLLQYSLNKLYGESLTLDGNFGSQTLLVLRKHYNVSQVDKSLYLKILNQMVAKFNDDSSTAEAIEYFNSQIKF